MDLRVMPLGMRSESALCREYLNNTNGNDAARNAGLFALGHYLPYVILHIQHVGGL